MKFEHPLARSAKVWPARLQEGAPTSVLVIVTTLQLDPEAKRFKSDLVEKLENEARVFLLKHPELASGVMLVNRPKDW